MFNNTSDQAGSRYGLLGFVSVEKHLHAPVYQISGSEPLGLRTHRSRELRHSVFE